MGTLYFFTPSCPPVVRLSVPDASVPRTVHSFLHVSRLVWFVSFSFLPSNSGVLIDKITRSLPPLSVHGSKTDLQTVTSLRTT